MNELTDLLFGILAFAAAVSTLLLLLDLAEDQPGPRCTAEAWPGAARAGAERATPLA